MKTNQKWLHIVMTIGILLGVYITMYYCLPQKTGRDTERYRGQRKVVSEDVTESAAHVVVLDSGHGGIDPGKESADGTLEKYINLAIATKLQQMLEQNGVKVVMTRTDDAGLYQETDHNKKIADMKKRCEIITQSHADLVVSIHQNSYSDTRAHGAQVFYYKHSANGKKLAQILQKNLKNGLDADNQRVEKPDTTYYMLLHTKVPTVIAECGFLSNPQETKLLQTEEYQTKVALALYNGIIEYLQAAS